MTPHWNTTAHIVVSNDYRATSSNAEKAMATNETEVDRKSEEQELKHLGFVKIAAIQALVCVSNLYEYAKQNSGPLRSAVDAVEGTVTTVIGPVYDKFNAVPQHLLVFVDNKVDEATHIFYEHAPPIVKHVAKQAKGVIEEVTHKAEKVISEAQSGGPQAAAHYVATESKQFVLIGSVKLWAGLNHYPPFHVVAEIVVPTVAHWSEKYNHVVKDMSGKGYTVFGYFPLIPIDEIARTFKQSEAKVNEDERASLEHKSESSDSDSH